MDCRNVEAPFWRHACAVHVALIGSLIAYAVFETCQIVGASRSPPVETLLQDWRGAGKWALCSSSSILRAGLSLPTTKQLMANEEVVNSTDERGSMLLHETIEINGQSQSCVIVDLSDWEMPLPPPVPLHLCADAGTGKVNLYLQHPMEGGGEGWQYLGNRGGGSRLVLKLDKHKHGWNLGYTSTEHDYYQVSRAEMSCCSDRTTKCSHWTEFESSKGSASYWRLVIETPMVSVSRKLGVLPQLFALLGRLGGYLSILTATFTALFVRKYPDSDLAKAFETRTLIGYQQRDNPPDWPVINTSPMGGAQDTNFLMQQRHSPQIPELPPGIVQPAPGTVQAVGYRQTE